MAITSVFGACAWATPHSPTGTIATTSTSGTSRTTARLILFLLSRSPRTDPMRGSLLRYAPGAHRPSPPASPPPSGGRVAEFAGAVGGRRHRGLDGRPQPALLERLEPGHRRPAGGGHPGPEHRGRLAGLGEHLPRPQHGLSDEGQRDVPRQAGPLPAVP